VKKAIASKHADIHRASGDPPSWPRRDKSISPTTELPFGFQLQKRF
jgi:hypothetical protein